LQDNCFYRVSRIDFQYKLSKNVHPSEYDNLCKNSSFRVSRQGWEIFETTELRNKFWKEWEENQKLVPKFVITYPRSVGEYNSVAAGDWTAFNKEKFVELKGYVEKETYGGWDSIMLMIGGVSLRMCQCNLNAPFATYHQEHNRAQNKNLPQTLYGPIWNDVLAGKNPQTNGNTWGLRDLVLPEVSLINDSWVQFESPIIL